MAQSLLVLHGPNLNLLGSREPEIYGHLTLSQIDGQLREIAAARGAKLESFQSNHEGQLIDRVQDARRAGFDYLIVNPAGFTHTSVALRDALLGIDLPYIEVHLSNIHRREPFRHLSYFSDKATAVICGLGVAGYRAAVNFALDAAAQ